MPSVPPSLALPRTRLHEANADATDPNPPRAARSDGAAAVTRQVSLWPFGTRSAHLYLLVDPYPADPAAVQVLLRAMQQQFFRSEDRSQTNALRSSILAAHYVLRQRNASCLPQDRMSAAVVCAAARSGRVYVALAGRAAAYAGRPGGVLSQQSSDRTYRPVGAEQLPAVTFWSAPFEAGDTLILVCGGSRDDNSAELLAGVLKHAEHLGEEKLSVVLRGPDGPARVLVTGAPGSRLAGDGTPLLGSGLATPSGRRGARVSLAQSIPAPGWPRRLMGDPRRLPRWARRLALGATLGVVVAAALVFRGAPDRSQPRLVEEAERLLDRSSGVDSREGYALATQALALAIQTSGETSGLADRARRAQDAAARVVRVRPRRVASLGQRGTQLVDLAQYGRWLVALDLTESAVRVFDPDAPPQALASVPLLVRPGTRVGGFSLAAPVAVLTMGVAGGAPTTAVLDQNRSGLLLNAGDPTARPFRLDGVPLREITAAASDGPILYVLDRAAGAVFAFDPLGTSPGQVVFRQVEAPSLPLDRAVDIQVAGDVYFRTDDGRVVRSNLRGALLPLDLDPPDDPVGSISSFAAGPSGTLYVADPSHRRVVHLAADGRLIRQVRAETAEPFATVHGLRASADARRLWILDGTELLSVDLPADVPAPLDPAPLPAPHSV